MDRAARLLVPISLRLGLSANGVTAFGFVAGVSSAFCLSRIPGGRWLLASFILSLLWLLADSLDGMVARASGTTSALGRELDGLADHGVFLVLYIALGYVLGAPFWGLVLGAAITHVIQANLYEAERRRFRRRCDGLTLPPVIARAANPATRLYDKVATLMDRKAEPFDRSMQERDWDPRFVAAYRRLALTGFRLLTSLSADARILILFAACFLRRPALFCWIEIGPMSLFTAAALLWHRALERRFMMTRLSYSVT